MGRGRHALLRLFALVGVALSLCLATALALDLGDLDRTRGGYEAPYTGFTGEPLRFEEVALTAEGGLLRGRVLDSLISCRTGVWRFEVLGFSFDYRTVSERAWWCIARRFCAGRGASTPRPGTEGTKGELDELHGFE